MLLTKRLRGGILLYSLLMAGIFTLLLQVYLGRVLANQRQHLAQVQASQSRLIAELTADVADQEHKDNGQLTFSKGTSTYDLKEQTLTVTVILEGHSRHYTYLKEQPK